MNKTIFFAVSLLSVFAVFSGLTTAQQATCNLVHYGNQVACQDHACTASCNTGVGGVGGNQYSYCFCTVPGGEPDCCHTIVVTATGDPDAQGLCRPNITNCSLGICDLREVSGGGQEGKCE